MTSAQRSNRRRFFQQAGGGLAATMTVGLSLGTAISPALGAAPEAEKQRPFRLAMASYSLRKFDLDQALEMTAAIGLDAICLKSFHLPLDLSATEIAASAARVKDAGIQLYGGGVITMRNEQEVHQAFEYAKAAGMTKIIGNPAPAVLPLIHDMVQQCDIEVCIHNHGPGDKNYPTPDVAYQKIKDLDRRVGLCHDVGHTVRIGKDPIAISEQCADRLLDVHIKDVTEATPKGHSIACGRGVIDLPSLMKVFAKIKYEGFLSFEYEENPNDPLPGLAESVGYIRGIMDMMT